MKRALPVALAILVILAASIGLVFRLDNPAPLAFATVASGILTFYQFVSDPSDPSSQLDSRDARLRAAIASALVVQYLLLVGVAAYFTNSAVLGKLPQITETLLASFTATIGIVIAFYFGASAYVDGKRASGNGP